MWPWSCSITIWASQSRRWNMVSAPNGPDDVDAGASGLGDRRRDDLDLLAAEQAVLAGMRVEPADADARRRDPHAPQRAGGGADHVRDPLARHHRERVPHAAMQRHVHHAVVVEAQHQVDVARVDAGLARHERRVAVERDAGERDRLLGLRRRHHRLDLARQRRLDGAAGGVERGAAIGGIDAAEPERDVVAARRCEHGHRAVGPRGLRDLAHHLELGVEPAGAGMQLDRRRIADQQRPADLPHAGSRAALRLTSGPMPAGSPVAMAMRGKASAGTARSVPTTGTRARSSRAAGRARARSTRCPTAAGAACRAADRSPAWCRA